LLTLPGFRRVASGLFAFGRDPEGSGWFFSDAAGIPGGSREGSPLPAVIPEGREEALRTRW